MKLMVASSLPIRIMVRSSVVRFPISFLLLILFVTGFWLTVMAKHHHRHRTTLRSVVLRTPLQNGQQIRTLVQRIQAKHQKQMMMMEKMMFDAGQSPSAATSPVLDQCYSRHYRGREIDILGDPISEVIYKFLAIETSTRMLGSKQELKSRIQVVASNLEKLLMLVNDCMRQPVQQRTQYGLTSLVYLSPNEYRQLQNPNLNRRKMIGGPMHHTIQCEIPAIDHNEIGHYFDWRNQGMVTPIKDQGQCGACFIFAPVATVESANLIRLHRANLPLPIAPWQSTFSEQALLNCINRTEVCTEGGDEWDTFRLMKNMGVTPATKMGYLGSPDRCNPKLATKKIVKNFCERFAITDEHLQAIIMTNGPVAVDVDASAIGWQFLTDVYQGPCSVRPRDANHVVAVVGWDEHHWIIKNSWGTGWGSQGYFRLPRGRNMCGMNNYISRPILVPLRTVDDYHREDNFVPATPTTTLIPTTIITTTTTTTTTTTVAPSTINDKIFVDMNTGTAIPELNATTMKIMSDYPDDYYDDYYYDDGEGQILMKNVTKTPTTTTTTTDANLKNNETPLPESSSSTMAKTEPTPAGTGNGAIGDQASPSTSTGSAVDEIDYSNWYIMDYGSSPDYVIASPE